jgi:hypothetical protein
MTAPTTMNAVKSSRWSTPAGSRATLLLATARATFKMRPAPKMASMAQATQVERFRTALPRLLRVL